MPAPPRLRHIIHREVPAVRIFRLAGRLLKADRRTLLVYSEACLYLGWARILLLLPFARTASSLGARSEVTSDSCEHPQADTIRSISRALGSVSRRTPWQSECLVRAVAGMKMLERRGISSTLYLGTGKDRSGAFIAHAWLRSGPYYLTGADVMNRFVVVETFANRGNRPT